MARTGAGRRAYGTGSIRQRSDRPGVWYGSWWVDGQRVQRALGPVKSKTVPDGLTAKEAERALQEVMASTSVEDVARKPRADRTGGRTIADVLEEYVADHAGGLKAHTTAHDYRRTVSNWFEPHFRGKSVDEITADDVRRLRDEMSSRRLRKHGNEPGAGLAPKSIRNHLTLLSTLLSYAVERGWAQSNVAARVPRPGDKAQGTGLRFFEPHEVTDLIAHAEAGPYHAIDRAMYLTAAQTGLRLGELRALRWESVDLERRCLRVERGFTRGQESSPKSKRERSVPLAPAVLSVLAELRGDATDPAARVFGDPFTGGPLTGTPLRRRYIAARDAADLPALPFHSLRHTFGTTLARNGCPVGDIQAYMGHSDLKTTQLYMHYAPRHDEADRFGAWFQASDPRTVAAQIGTQLVPAA